MAVKIRLARFGKTGKAVYRLVAIDEHFKRNGRAIEVLGTYNPHGQTPEEKLKVKADRVKYWLSVGAKPTETAANLLKL